MKKIIFTNIIWYFFISLSCFIALWFSSKTFIDIVRYQRLEKIAPIIVTRWEIEEKKEGIFFVGASYKYKVENEDFEGKATFSRKFFNYHAAFDYLNKLAQKKDLVAWYSKKNVRKATLEKHFPVKNLVYAVVSTAIFIYFIILKNIIKRFN